MKAVILAAGRGTRLEPLTRDIPKCMAPVGGRPLIDRLIERVRAAGIDELVVVTGHLAGTLERHLAGSADPLARTARLVYNDRYAEWGNFYSLLVAREALAGSGFVRLDGDVLLGERVLPRVLAAARPAAVLAVDTGAVLAAEEMKAAIDGTGHVVALSKELPPAAAAGEFIGVDRIDTELGPALFAELAGMIERGETDEYYERAYALMMQRGVPFGYVDVADLTWCEIDDAADLAHAEAVLAQSPAEIE